MGRRNSRRSRGTRRRTRTIGDQLERVGEFAKKSQADEKPGERPPPGEARAALEREPEGVERRYPKENRERINRQDEAAEVEDGSDIHCDHRPEAGQRAEQVPREIIEKQARARREERTPETHPKLIVAKEHRARPNDECDPRAFTEIGERGPLRPHPVIRFVGRELRGADERKPERGQPEEKDPDGPGRAHAMASPTRRGCLTKNCGAQRAAAFR